MKGMLLVVLAYWAPDHIDMNSQVLRKGEPFAFKRVEPWTH